MEYNENTYSSFDLMKIFGIKKGSWQSVKKKFDLDNYGERTFDVRQNQYKYVYSQKAYDVLKDNYQQKVNEEVKENPRMLALITENNTLRATIEEYKNLNLKFEEMYKEEKEKRETLLVENSNLSNSNGAYIEKNHNLEREKFERDNIIEKLKEEKDNKEDKIRKLQEENNRLKNRGLIARIFNK